MDRAYIRELGPFLKVLGNVTYASEKFKKEGDKVTTGKEISDVAYNMSGAMLLFRGAAMMDEWIEPYVSNIGKSVIRLPSNNSTSKSIIVALTFAMPTKKKKDCTATLFVIACQNYDKIQAMTMTLALDIA